MPYPLQRSVTSTTPTIPSPLRPKTLEENQEREATLISENAAWQGQYREAVRENDVLMGLLEQKAWELRKKEQKIIELVNVIQEKDAILDRILGGKKRRMNLFDGPHSDFED